MPKRSYSYTNDDNDDDYYPEKDEIIISPPPLPPLKKRKIEYLKFDYKNFNTLDSLIEVVKNNKNVYNIDIIKLNNIIKELKELKELIGMKEVKTAIISQVLFFIQGLNKDDMMHTVIQGPSGSGKTTLAKIISKIYLKLGYLDNNKFIIAKRSDLIGEYLGQTAKKTERMINKASGGVLFIDEAYALGSGCNNSDSYSKECIDTLNQHLSEKKDFICIIAGYEKELKKCFFSRNQGLQRRFPWIYNITKYNEGELYNIFVKLVVDNGWKLKENSINKDFFKQNLEMFPHYGGSCLTFLSKVKIAHSQRVFGQEPHKKKIINNDDVKRGYEMYLKYQQTEKNVNSTKPPPGMYL